MRAYPRRRTVTARTFDDSDIPLFIEATWYPGCPPSADHPGDAADIEIVAIHDDLGQPLDFDDMDPGIQDRVFAAVDDAIANRVRGEE